VNIRFACSLVATLAPALISALVVGFRYSPYTAPRPASPSPKSELSGGYHRHGGCAREHTLERLPLSAALMYATRPDIGHGSVGLEVVAELGRWLGDPAGAIIGAALTRPG
jgi:hypothetical protein